MKSSKSHNNFDKLEIDKWFGYNYECWVCGKNHWNCFHHIVGRGKGDSKCERSILNACPVNNFQCHLPIHGTLKSEENQAILLQKTLRYLIKQGYKFNDLDNEFIIEYKKFYDVAV